MSFASEYEKLRKKRLEEEEKKLDSTLKKGKATEKKSSSKSYADEYTELRTQREEKEAAKSETKRNLLSGLQDYRLQNGRPDLLRGGNLLPSALGDDDEDIAPVKKKDDDKKLDFFQKGAFEDGYQIGDVTKAILGTAGDLGLGVVQGLGGFAEGIVDWGAQRVADVYDKIGTNDAKLTASQLRKTAAQKQLGELLDPADEFLEKYSVAGRTLDAGAQGLGTMLPIIATGGLGAVAGLGTVGSTLLTSGVTFLSGMGSGTSEAIQSGATAEEANKYGAAAGAADAVWEMVFGGIGKGMKAVGLGKGLTSLDDMAAKAASKFLKSQTGKNIVEWTVKSGFEGLEEVGAGFTQAVAKKMTYMSEEEFGKILEDENLLEQFFAGAMTAGMTQAGIVPGMKQGSLIEANKTGKDFITGYTQNEQSVIDKEIENRIKSEEKDGKKLTNKEKAAIEEQVAKDLDKGYISTDTIEEALGGDTYKSYKSTIESEDAIVKEYDELANIPENELSRNQRKRLDELETQIEEARGQTKRKDLRSKLDADIGSLVKDSRLAESYREVGRRGEKYTADLTKYNEKQKQVIQKAIDSGILNNTNRTHEFVDLVAKISADKGVLFDFTDNAKLKESGFAVDGKEVNGYVTKDGITLNMSSSKAWQKTVGHEITHVLEGTELYTELQTALKQYAENKGDYQGRYDTLTKLYEGIEGANIDAELTADLVGDYLFSDENFINNLSVNNRNVFQKIYDEIKYLAKVVTAGSKEARELEKVKRAFEKAYRENSNAVDDGDVKFSVRKEAPPKKTEKAYKLMRYVDGKLYPLFIGNNEEVSVGKWYNADSPNLSQLKDLEPGTHLVDMTTGEAMTWDEYAEEHLPKKNGVPVRNKPNKADIHWANDNGYRFMHIEDKAGGRSADRMLKQYGDTRAYYNWGVNGSSKSASGEGSASLYALRPGWHFGAVPSMHQIGYGGDAGDTVRLDNQVWVEVDMSADVDYNAEAESNWGGDIPTHIPTDGYYKYATNPTQKKTKKGNTANDATKADWYVAGAFKANRILSDAEADAIVEQYNREHGTNVPLDYRRNGGRVFNAETMSIEDAPKYSISEDSNGKKLSKEQSDFFKDSKIVDENGNLRVMYHGTPNGDFTVFNDGTYFTADKEYADKYQSPSASSLNSRKVASNPKTFEVYLNITKPFDINDPEARSIYINDYIKGGNAIGIDPYMSDAEYDKISSIDWTEGEDLRDFLVENGYDYDGLVLDEGAVGGYGDAVVSRGTSYVVFSPEQVKNVDNQNPTSDPDIRYSLSEDSDGRPLSQAVATRFANSKVVDDNGNLMSVFHGTASGEFSIFDKAKGSVEGDFGSGFYFTDNEADVTEHYEDGGPDFDNKIARRAEQIEAEEEIDYEEAEQRAREELYKGGHKFEVYLNIENPAIVGETMLLDGESYREEYNEEDYDDYDDYIADVEQLLADDIDNIVWEVERNVDVNDTEGIAGILYDAYTEGGIGIEALKARINELYLEDSEGNLVGNEVTRQIIESLGYDGIIDPTVSGKWNMDIEEGTKHYIVFKPNQIKAVTNENPTDNPDIHRSISNVGEAPVGKGVPLRDLRYQPTEEAPVPETVQETPETVETVAPVEEDNYDLGTLYDEKAALEERWNAAVKENADNDTIDRLTAEYLDLEQKIREAEAAEDDRLASLDDADAPPEAEAPYYGEEEKSTVTIDAKSLKGIARRVGEQLALNRNGVRDVEQIIQRYAQDANYTEENLLADLTSRFGEYEDDFGDGHIKEAQNFLRTYPVKVTDERASIPDYTKWMRKHFGKIRFSNNATMGVDEVYQDLNANFPDLFPDDITEKSDQLLRMGEVADMATKGMFERDAEEMKYTAEDIIDSVYVYSQSQSIADAEDSLASLMENADDYAPLPDDVPATETVKPAEHEPYDPEKPIKTAEERIAAKIANLQTELADNTRLRTESAEQFDSVIANLKAEYNSKKNKNTKAANDILRRIERIRRLKGNVDADYSKRISDLEKRIEKADSKTARTAEQRRTKMAEHTSFWEKLIGDTSTWRDLALGLSYKTKTMRRFLRQVVRDASGKPDVAKADAIYDALETKYDHNEALLKRESQKLKENFFKLKLTHAEDTYAHMLGELRHNPETHLTKDEVEAYYNKHKKQIDTEKVDKAIADARQLFDDLIVRVNAVLKEQGMKEIPYRKGYFPHFTNPKQGWLAKLLNWKTVNTEIPTDIAGLTEQFNPERSWQGFNKERTSDNTDYSLYQGLDTYIHGALDWIYHIDDLQSRRSLENYLRSVHSEETVKAKIDEIKANEDYDADEAQAQIELVLNEARNPLNNLVTELRSRTNTLANKKASMDRGMEEATNRKIYSTMTNLNNRVTSNMVVGSLSSALTNIIPVVQSWHQVSPVFTVRGLGDYVRSSIKDDGMVAKSDFLTNRLIEEENLYKTGWDKASDKAAFMMNAIDSITSQTVWRSKYLQNIKEGMSENEAIRDADQFAKNLMAGRSRGNAPSIFDAKNPLIKAFTAFQLEVANQYGFMFKDTPQDVKNKARLVKGYAAAFMGAHLYNALYSSMVGRDAAFDPISIFEDLFRDLGWFGDDDEEEKEGKDVILNLVDNVLEEVPYIGGFLGGGRVPIQSALPYSNVSAPFETMLNDVTEGNVANFGKELLKPLYYMAMPMGGGQIKKAVEGLSMFDDDLPIAGSYTKSGSLRFPVDDTLASKVQAGLFGQYASKDARYYFDNGISPLNEKQIQEYIDSELPIRDYWEYREGLSGLSKLEEKADYINSLDLPISTKNLFINNIANRKDPIDMGDYGEYGSLEEFDFANEYPEKYEFLRQNGVSFSAYKSKKKEYDYAYKNPEKYAFLNEIGVSYDDFDAADDDTKEAYDWAYKNPGKLVVSKAITGDFLEYYGHKSNLDDFDAKDEYGNTVNGLKKERVLDYINSMDADYGQKIILFKSYYPKDDTYNYDIIDYLNSREDISYEEMNTILVELGFTIGKDGKTIYWD